MPYEQKINAKIMNLVKYCKDKRIGLIFMSDSNSHSQLWNNRGHSNYRGLELESFIIAMT